MEVTGETCKLCLKYIQGDDLALLDETILGKLEFLQMDLDQSVEESNALCKECEEKIESAFDFKSCLVNTESCLVPYVSEDKTQKVNLRVILEKDTSSSGKGESSVEKEVCRLCKNFVKTNTVISLPKVLKDDTIMEVFQGHIPEMDLDVTENPMVCDSCHNSLASFSTLIASWSIANGWNEDDEDMKEDFEMVNVKNETLDGFSDSKTNSSASFLENSGSGPSNSKNGRIEIPKIKTEIDEISDSTSESVTVPKVIKKEECADEEDAVTTIDQDLQLKSEEVEIKDEDGFPTVDGGVKREIPKFGEKFRPSNTSQLINSNYKCGKYSYIAKGGHSLKRHLLKHNSITDVQYFKCTECRYVSKSSNNLARHSLIHTSLNEIKLFKCDKCPHLSKTAANLRAHILNHERSNEVETFSCKLCSFETNHAAGLKKHLLVHKNFNEVDIFKCERCTYTSRHFSSMRRHLLAHQSKLLTKTSKCHKCYEGKCFPYLPLPMTGHESENKEHTLNCRDETTESSGELQNHRTGTKSLGGMKTL